MKKKNRPNDVISIPHRSYVSLNGYIIDNQRGILSYKIRQLPCHARGARTHNPFSQLPFRMDSFVHGNVNFFPLFDRLVCTLQSNQRLDALIKYVS